MHQNGQLPKQPQDPEGDTASESEGEEYRMQEDAEEMSDLEDEKPTTQSQTQRKFAAEFTDSESEEEVWGNEVIGRFGPANLVRFKSSEWKLLPKWYWFVVGCRKPAET